MILTIDIGTGTQDILLYDENERFRENLIKMVLPSPSLKFFNRVKKMTGDIFVKGDLIGGGPLKKALERHLEKGNRVCFDNISFQTVRDSKEEVLARGFEISSNVLEMTNILSIKEFDIELFRNIFSYHDIDIDEIDSIAFACQDHGFRDMIGKEREYRLNLFYSILKKDADLRNLIFTEKDLPDTFLRMRSICKRVRKEGFKGKLYLMDTAFAACLGVMQDKRFDQEKYNLIINFGNSHTLGVITKRSKVYSLFEHHTRILQRNNGLINDIIEKFIKGTLCSKELIEQNGHGCFSLDDNIINIDKIFVTGPRREHENLKVSGALEASPWGDMMLTGNVGLLKGMDVI